MQNADLGEWVPLVPPPLDELPVPSRVREIFADPFTGLAPGAMPSLFRVTVGLHYRAGKAQTEHDTRKQLVVTLAHVLGRRGRGNPNVGDSYPAQARAAAWLQDIRGVTAREVLIQLGLAPSSGPPHDDRNIRQRARRFRERGRQRLNRECVLPWAVFPRGELPDIWWQEPQFLVGLMFWLVQTQRANPFPDLTRNALQAQAALMLGNLFSARRYPPSLLAGSGGAVEAARRYWRAVAMLNHPTLTWDVSAP